MSNLKNYVVPWLETAKTYSLSDVDDAIAHPEKARMMINECPIEPSETVIEAITRAARSGNRYPGSNIAIRRRIGALYGVGPEQVLVVGGSSEIIDAAMRVFLQPGDEVIIPRPTFSLYEIRATVVGGKPVLVDMTKDMQYDTQAMIKAITPRTKLIVVCNPNNPTGNFIPDEELRMIASQGIPIFLDEAYLEFYSEKPSKASWINEFPNLFVTHTFSKAFGLAGVRFGYMIASKELIRYFEKVQIPWSASVMSIAAAEAILDHKEELSRKAEFNRKSVEFFCKVLGELPGVKPYHSHGNYILVDATDTGKTSEEIVTSMYEKGFIIKTMPPLHGRKGFFRITPGTQEENERLAKELKRFFTS